MRTFTAIVFPTEATAYTALRTLERLHHEGKLRLHATLVIEQQADGSIVTKTSSQRPLRRTGIGAVAGGLVGVVGGPAGVVAGMAVGAFAGMLDDAVRWRVRETCVDWTEKFLAPGSVALLADLQEKQAHVIDEPMEDLGGEIHRQPAATAIDDIVHESEREHAGHAAALRLLRTDEDAERDENFLESDLQDMRSDLRWSSESVREQLENARNRLDRKIRDLDDEIARASPELRKDLERRMTAIKRDLTEREAKLTRALDLADEALRR